MSVPRRGADGRLGLTVSEVAAELGVSDNTVRRWADAGHLRASRTPGRQRRFTRAALDAFIRQAETASTGGA
jgi:excisionase family DNA binding protein